MFEFVYKMFGEGDAFFTESRNQEPSQNQLSLEFKAIL